MGEKYNLVQSKLITSPVAEEISGVAPSYYIFLLLRRRSCLENYHDRVLRPQEIDSSSSRSYISITIIVVSLAVLFKETTKNQVNVTLNCLVEMSLVVPSNSMEVLSSASSGGACWILLVTNR